MYQTNTKHNKIIRLLLLSICYLIRNILSEENTFLDQESAVVLLIMIFEVYWEGFGSQRTDNSSRFFIQRRQRESVSDI